MIVTHDALDAVVLADRIVVLDRGTIAGQFMKHEVTLDQLIDRLYRVAATGELDKGTGGGAQ